MQHLYNVCAMFFADVEQRAQARQDGYIADHTRLRFELLYTGHVESTAHRRFIRAQGQAMSGDALTWDVSLFKDAKLVARVQYEP